MQKWEYQTFVINLDKDGKFTVSLVDQKPIGKEKPGFMKTEIIHPYLEDYLREIGNTGWEVVSTGVTIYQAGGGTILVIAKRPQN